MQNFLSYRRDETCMLNVCEKSDEESLFRGQVHHRTDALLQLQHLQASNHCLGSWVQLQVQSNPIFNQPFLCPLFCFVGVGIHEGVLGGDHAGTWGLKGLFLIGLFLSGRVAQAFERHHDSWGLCVCVCGDWGAGNLSPEQIESATSDAFFILHSTDYSVRTYVERVEHGF